MEKLNAVHIANYAAWQLQDKGQCSPATPAIFSPGNNKMINKQLNAF